VRSTSPPTTRADFVKEALVGVGTPLTPDFWSRPDSYRVDKHDLLDGLRGHRETLGGMLRGVVIVGPTGELARYSVVTFLEHGERGRMNWLIFPHGRITSKGVLDLAPRDRARLFDAIAASPAMHAGDPAAETTGDATYQVLAADWSAGTERVWHSSSDAAADDLQGIYDALEALLARGTQTYGNYGSLTTDEILTQIGF
jgi:hypothetical protein